MTTSFLINLKDNTIFELSKWCKFQYNINKQEQLSNPKALSILVLENLEHLYGAEFCYFLTNNLICFFDGASLDQIKSGNENISDLEDGDFKIVNSDKECKNRFDRIKDAKQSKTRQVLTTIRYHGDKCGEVDLNGFYQCFHYNPSNSECTIYQDALMIDRFTHLPKRCLSCTWEDRIEELKEIKRENCYCDSVIEEMD